MLRSVAKWIAGAMRGRAGSNERVLMIASERQDASGRVCRHLRCNLEYASDLPAAFQDFSVQNFDVVIYDQDLPQQEWRRAIRRLAAAAPSSSILLLSRLGYPELWGEVIQCGGHDLLRQPVNEERAESVVALAVARAKARSNPAKRKIVMA